MTDPIRLDASKWVRHEMAPVARRRRSIGGVGFMFLWVQMAAQLGVFALGASLAEAMSVPTVLLAVLVGNLVMVPLLVLIGDIGVEHGVNFASYLRAPFGMLGSFLPLALRGGAGIAWFGIQTYLGATAVNTVTEQLFDLSALPVWYLAFGAAQVALVAAGLDVIRRVVNVAAPTLVLLAIAMIALMVREGSVDEILQHPVDDPDPFLVGLVANASYWTTVAINLPDFTRHLRTVGGRGFARRNRSSIGAQLIGVPVGMLLFTTVGMTGFVVTGESNPVLAIAATVGGALLVFALGLVVLAQLSTNITANLYASSYAANAIGAPRVSFRTGAYLTGAAGLLLTFPWLLLDAFLLYLPALGAILAPVAGIMVADYYLVRRRHLDVPALFDPGGQYRYWRGVNPAAAIAWAIGAGAGLVVLDFGLLLAFPIGLLVYWALMHWWVAPRYPQDDRGGAPDRFLAASVDRDWPIEVVHPDTEDDDETGELDAWNVGHRDTPEPRA